MDERDWLVERFEEHRPHLRAVAYRMLGSLAEADEAVQDAWLRVSRAGADGVENFRGWLTTIVARVCLNALQARKARPEDSAGVHLPDPIVKPAGEVDPEYEVLMADSVGLALQVVSTRCPQPSDWFSCCTTCSTCRSMRSDPWWGALQPQRGSSPAVPGDACTEHPRRSRTPALLASDRSSMRSSPPRAAATSTRSSRCWIPTSCSDRMAAKSARPFRSFAVERAKWRGRRCDLRSRALFCILSSSMAPQAQSP
jgi:hypothetical protein